MTTEGISGGLEPKRPTSVTHHEEKIGLLIPCEVSRFGEFVSGLLGQKQTIDGFETGHFDIGQQEIANTFHLIQQRMETQNESTLAAFSLKVIYDNGNAVTHTTIAAFQAYHPIEPCHPIEVIMSLTYLVSFKGRSVPEKQVIEIAFVCLPHPWRDPRKRRYYAEGAIEYRIEYTERTWGSDISALLSNHAKSIVKKRGKVGVWVAENHDEVFVVASVLLLVVTIGGWSWYTSNHSAALSTLGSVIPYMAWSVFIVAAFWGVLKLVKVFFRNYIYLTRPSFIQLVDRDKKFREESLAKERKYRVAAIVGWVMSALASLAASYAYAYLIS